MMFNTDSSIAYAIADQFSDCSEDDCSCIAASEASMLDFEVTDPVKNRFEFFAYGDAVTYACSLIEFL